MRTLLDTQDVRWLKSATRAPATTAEKTARQEVRRDEEIFEETFKETFEETLEETRKTGEHDESALWPGLAAMLDERRRDLPGL